MLRRLLYLTLLQLSDRFKIKKVVNVKKLLAKIGIMVFGLAIISAICFLIFYLLNSIIFITTPRIITFAIVLLQILSIVACAVGLLKTLYQNKDNAILLSYPARHVEVFISKLMVYYIYEFIKSFFFILPLIVSFGLAHNYFSFWYVISTVFFVFTLPIFPVLIGALLTIPILFIKKLILKIPYVKTILLLLLLIGLFIVFFQIMNIIPKPLRLIELYTTFINGITEFLENFDRNSLFYRSTTNILIGENVLINYLIYIGSLLGLFGLVTLISMPIYFSLASSSRELSTKNKRVGVNKVSKNTFLTFFKKEWLLSIRDFGEFINNYIFMFATPYVLFIMVGFYSSIDLNPEGEYMAVAFSAFVALAMSSASNTSSALAITKEGSEFVLLKTVPADASKMVWAKIFFNLIFSTIMIIISFALVIIFGPMLDKGQNGIEWKWLLNNDWLWLMMVSTVIINAAMIFWSLQIDIMNPKLREYASSGDVSGMNNASKSIMIGLLVSVLFTIISLLILFDGSNMVLNWTIIIGICVLFLVARLYLFISHLKHIFPYIEY